MRWEIASSTKQLSFTDARGNVFAMVTLFSTRIGDVWEAWALLQGNTSGYPTFDTRQAAMRWCRKELRRQAETILAAGAPPGSAPCSEERAAAKEQQAEAARKLSAARRNAEAADAEIRRIRQWDNWQAAQALLVKEAP